MQASNTHNFSKLRIIQEACDTQESNQKPPYVSEIPEVSTGIIHFDSGMTDTMNGVESIRPSTNLEYTNENEKINLIEPLL